MQCLPSRRYYWYKTLITQGTGLTLTKINLLTLFKEISAVYSENCTKQKNTLCEQNAELVTVKVSGVCSYRYVWKGYLRFHVSVKK
jgi:hypothetical protein